MKRKRKEKKRKEKKKKRKEKKRKEKKRLETRWRPKSDRVPTLHYKVQPNINIGKVCTQLSTRKT